MTSPPDLLAPQLLRVLERHGDHPSAFLALNDDTRHFRMPGIDGVIAYRTAGRRHVVMFGGVFADRAEQPVLLEAFRRWAAGRRRRVCAVQLLRADGELLAGAGFRVNQLGASYGIDLERFSLRGQRFVKTRNMLSRSRRAGLTVGEAGVDIDPLPRLASALDAVDRAWLQAKGARVRELAFMIGERGGRGAPYRRLFVAHRADDVVGYVSLSPCAGTRPGWLYDLTRRTPEAPPGTVELLVVTALERLRDERAGWLHLGFTPFAGLDPAHEIAGAYDRLPAWIVRQIAERGAALYPAATQAAFKLKWQPHLVAPEYIAFDRGARPEVVWQLLRLTRSL